MGLLCVFTARGSEGSIVFSVIAVFFSFSFLCFSINMIPHELLHLA